MANYKQYHQYAAVLLLFLFLLSSSSSSARPLNGVMSLAAIEPTLNNIALPSVVPEEKEELSGHVSPCDQMGVVARKVPSPGMRLAGGKYGPLILNMLPKGKVPPSGPSKGTNGLNN